LVATRAAGAIAPSSRPRTVPVMNIDHVADALFVIIDRARECT
jgi:hypothetical protein